ncbi:hypothetical protein EAI_01795 [Harpegnathos saltator]|uniref:Uncharacterized protein n=1 Tax=Harpegnathos saltator TaxID=610380 RepID=E2BBU1_HARSA|nr:hypothetical protein EAI_01795 [Harpegnathos saltator]
MSDGGSVSLRDSILDELRGIFAGDRFHGLPETFESLETLKQRQRRQQSAARSRESKPVLEKKTSKLSRIPNKILLKPDPLEIERGKRFDRPKFNVPEVCPASEKLPFERNFD